MARSRFVVAGAGVVGASIAYHLALRGADGVVLADTDTIASGATGKALGGVRQQFSSAPEVRLARESVGFFRSLGPELFEPVGYLFLATTEDGLDELERRREVQASLGVPVERVDAARVDGPHDGRRARRRVLRGGRHGRPGGHHARARPTRGGARGRRPGGDGRARAGRGRPRARNRGVVSAARGKARSGAPDPAARASARRDRAPSPGLARDLPLHDRVGVRVPLPSPRRRARPRDARVDAAVGRRAGGRRDAW